MKLPQTYVLAISSLCIFGLVFGFFSLKDHSNYSWNQEVSIIFEYNGELITKSAFQSVLWKKNSYLGSVNGASWTSTLHGHMPYLDLDEGSVLVALLRTQENDEYAKKLLYDLYGNILVEADRLKKISEIRGSIDVPRNHFPTFALLMDATDPKEYKIISHHELSDEILKLSVNQVNISITSFNERDLKDIIRAVPYLSMPKFRADFARADISEDTWLLPKYIYRD